MFKSKLIEDKKYYTSRTVSIYLSILFSFIIGGVSSGILENLWVLGLVAIISFIILYVQTRHQLKIQALTQASIEINETQIRLLNKDNKHLSSISLENLSTVEFTDPINVLDPPLSATRNELLGDMIENKICFYLDNTKHEFHLLLESHYMIVQLKKLLEAWKLKGAIIKKIA